MIAKHVKDFGRLRLGDILQNLTLPEVVEIEGKDQAEMVYKTFFIKGKEDKNKKIELDKNMPDEMSSDEMLNASYALLEQEDEKGMEIAKVNPVLFRNLQYMVTISPDIMNPRSVDLERAYGLEEYDRMVSAPAGMFDMEETARLLLKNNPLTRKNPDKFLAKTQTVPQSEPGTMPMSGNSPLQGMIRQKNKPLSPTGALSPATSMSPMV
jgi:hypothetical protein